VTRDQRVRLEQELGATIRRLRDAGLAVTGHAVEGGGDPRPTDLYEAAQHAEIAEGRLGEGERLVRRLNRLRAALERYERGTYGACLDCGLAIPPARLNVVPEAALCVPCQERREDRARGAA